MASYCFGAMCDLHSKQKGFNKSCCTKTCGLLAARSVIEKVVATIPLNFSMIKQLDCAPFAARIWVIVSFAH